MATCARRGTQPTVLAMPLDRPSLYCSRQSVAKSLIRMYEKYANGNESSYLLEFSNVFAHAPDKEIE